MFGLLPPLASVKNTIGLCFRHSFTAERLYSLRPAENTPEKLASGTVHKFSGSGMFVNCPLLSRMRSVSS